MILQFGIFSGATLYGRLCHNLIFTTLHTLEIMNLYKSRFGVRFMWFSGFLSDNATVGIDISG